MLGIKKCFHSFQSTKPTQIFFFKKKNPTKNLKWNHSPQSRVSYLCQWVRLKKSMMETASGWVDWGVVGVSEGGALSLSPRLFRASPTNQVGGFSGYAGGWVVFELCQWVGGLSVPVR